MTWRELRARLRRDRERLLARYDAEPAGRPRLLWTNPSWQCVVLQRLSFFSYSHGWRLPGRLFWHLNLLLTGADIAMVSDFGPGLVILVPCAVIMVCHAGRDLTVHGLGGVGGGTKHNENIGAGPGVPVLGNDVELGWGAIIIGPITVGDGARIGALCLVTHNVPAGTHVPDGERGPRRMRKT